MRSPLDAHAHVQPDIDPIELQALDAHVVAVTRSPDDYEQTLHRTDPTTTWALGCHPGLSQPQRTFEPDRFRYLLDSAAVVGEVGLDGTSRVPLSVQLNVLEAILKILRDSPRLVTMHSASATSEVLDVLEANTPQGVVLHWWRGTARETGRAVEMGCYFSVNSREVPSPRVIHLVPRERLLTETDHPVGDRSEHAPRRPGNMSRIVYAVASLWKTSGDEVLRQVWENWREIALATETADLLPSSFKSEMLQA